MNLNKYANLHAIMFKWAHLMDINIYVYIYMDRALFKWDLTKANIYIYIYIYI